LFNAADSPTTASCRTSSRTPGRVNSSVYTSGDRFIFTRASVVTIRRKYLAPAGV
jgi:hypothetical protein